MNHNETDNLPARPIGDAATEIQAVALQLQQMLDDLQNGWLWQILTWNQYNTPGERKRNDQR